MSGFTVKWDIEPKCNLACKHCMMSDIEYKPALSLKENKTIARKLIDGGARRIVFQTMEPLLYDNIYKLISYCSSRNVMTGLITNGILLNEEAVLKLLEARLGYLIISLEGVTADTNDYIRGNGSFETVLQNINTLKTVFDKTGRLFYLVLEYNLTSINEKEIDFMFDFFDTLPFDTISIGEIVEHGRAMENREIKLKKDDILSIYKNLYDNYYIKARNYIINTKGLTPYEVVYLNTFFNADIPFYLASCSVRKGNTVSVSSEGVARICSLLNANENYGKFDMCNLNDIECFDINEQYQKLKTKIDYLSFIEEREVCVECNHYRECSFCPAADKSSVDKARKRCNIAKKRILEETEELARHKKALFFFPKGVYLEETENDITLHRLYMGNSVTKMKISNNYKSLLLKIYKNRKIYITDCRSKEFEGLYSKLILGDYISLFKSNNREEKSYVYSKTR